MSGGRGGRGMGLCWWGGGDLMGGEGKEGGMSFLRCFGEGMEARLRTLDLRDNATARELR